VVFPKCRILRSAFSARRLLGAVQEALQRRGKLDKPRFLLYPSRLTPADQQWIAAHSAGLKWLGKAK
jgi:hypothetical protein